VHELEWVVFDLETTGLSPDLDDIIQIAAVRMRGWRVLELDSFATYVDPGRAIPPFITSYTGIRQSDVVGAPPAADALGAFSRWVADSTLVADNGHRFDMKFVESTCRRGAFGTRAVRYHDSLAMSWQLWGRKGTRHGLDAILGRLRLGASGHRRHDARGDVALLGRAIEMMHNELVHRGEEPHLPLHSGVLPSMGLSGQSS
jgi:DNA polymerase III alpha subunit (gram-positive type)